MSKQIPGIHHVTAMAGDPQRNLDFYTRVLGLRLVKVTVNFDDPGTYHFYFGNTTGGPGTILTFFPWPGARRGRIGAGQVGTTAFSVPAGSLDFWQQRLSDFGVSTSRPESRFGEDVLPLTDPDGLQLELVAHADAAAFAPWEGGPVPAEQAVRGFHSVTLLENDAAPTVDLLTNLLGFAPDGETGERKRFRMGGESPDAPGTVVDVLHLPHSPRGTGGVGTVHHVAWRTPTDEEELAWQAEIAAAGHNITQVMDRQYFHSIYFREPGGVLFEIATDPPGFLWDESEAELGATGVKLPPWLEPQRGQIERILPAIELPGVPAP